VKETKTARDNVRIATKKIGDIERKLDDLKRSELTPPDSQIFPMYYAPIVINEDGENKIVLARYHCRQKGKPGKRRRAAL
jgi:hypothetical protein